MRVRLLAILSLVVSAAVLRAGATRHFPHRRAGPQGPSAWHIRFPQIARTSRLPNSPVGRNFLL